MTTTKLINTLFLDAVQSKSLDLVRYFLAQDNVDPSCRNNYAIYRAARNDDLAMVNLLLQDVRVNPQDTSGNIHGTASTPIRAACCFGYSDVVERLLLDERVDPSQRHSRALRRAVFSNYTTIVKALLEHGKADPAAHGNEALRIACNNSNATMVLLLLADPRTDPNMMSIKYVKVENGYAPVVVALSKLSNDNELCILKALFKRKAVEPTMYWGALTHALQISNNAEVDMFLSALLAQADQEKQHAKETTTTDTIVVKAPTTPPVQTIRLEINVRQEVTPPARRRVIVAKYSLLDGLAGSSAYYLMYEAGERLTVLFEDAFPNGYYYVENSDGDVGYAYKAHF